MAVTHWLTLRGPDPLNQQNATLAYDQFAEYRERANGKVVESVRFLAIEWDHRILLLKALLGTARLGAGLTNPETLTLTPYGLASTRAMLGNLPGFQDVVATRLQLNRLLPEPHPELPNLIAVDGEVLEGKGYPIVDANVNPRALQFYQNTANDPSYYSGQGVAKIAVTYRSLPYGTQVNDSAVNIAGGSELSRYVWRDPTATAQNLPIQGTYFKELNIDTAPFTYAATAIPEPAVKVYPSLRVIYHWMMVPAIPPSVMYAMSGLNQTDFDAGNFPIVGTAPAGTCQFLSPKISEPYYTWHGDKVFDIHYPMLFRQPGPNWRFRPGRGYFRLGINSFSNVGIQTSAVALGLINNPPEPLVAGLGLFNYYELANLFKMCSLGGPVLRTTI